MQKVRASEFLKNKRIRAVLIILLVLIILFIVLHPHGKKTYLLLGMDNYGSLNEIGRSDVMMLVQLDFDRCRITAVSFARDMFLEKKNGAISKINTIVRSYDEQTLVETLEENFDLTIDGWFRVNFTTVIELVDQLGGVTINLSAKEATYVNNKAGKYSGYPLKEGECRLCGGQALAYARCRKLDNDLGRGERQRKLASAMLAQAKKLSPFRLYAIYQAMKHAWTSSLSGGEQLNLAFKALWLLGSPMKSVGMPFDDTWKYGNDKNGNRGIIIQTDVNRQMLHEALGLPD